MATWQELKEGDEIDIEIKETSRTGDGIGRVHGYIVFVKGAKAGERVRVRIMKCAARHAHAELIKRL